jgi:hypothetical protein
MSCILSLSNLQSVTNCDIAIICEHKLKQSSLSYFHFKYFIDSAINIHIISYLLTKKRKERETSFLFCLYDSAINIHVFMLGN